MRFAVQMWYKLSTHPRRVTDHDRCDVNDDESGGLLANRVEGTPRYGSSTRLLDPLSRDVKMNTKTLAAYIVPGLLAISCADEAPSSSVIRDAHAIYIEVDQGSANMGRIYLDYDNKQNYSLVLHHHATTRTHQLALDGVLDFDPLEAMLAIPDEGKTARAYCVTIEHSAHDLEVVDDRVVHCVERLEDNKPLTHLFRELDGLQINGQPQSAEHQELREAFDWPLPSAWLP